MLNLFKKNEKMVDGVLYIKQESLEQMVEALVYIWVTMDADEDQRWTMSKGATVNGLTVGLPVTVTETIWKKLKKSGNVIKLVATKEQMMKKSSMTMKMETALSI